MSCPRAAGVFFFSLSALLASDIQGTLLVEKKLTRRNVTASIGAYQRGAAVPLATDPAEDPLVFERTHTAIWLEGALPSAPVTATMEQRDRRFTPDFLIIPAGSTVSFPNGDNVFHNVFSLSKPRSFDLGNYPRGDTRLVTFPKAGIVFVNCRLHPNMAAVVVVTPNGWAAKGDAAGHFTLRDVPPGAYTAVAWHKAAGFFRQTIVIRPNQDAAVRFVIPILDSKPGREVAQK